MNKKISILFLASLFSFSVCANEIDDLLENKEGLTNEELQQKIAQKRNELWQNYLVEKEKREAPVVNNEGQVSNGLSQEDQGAQQPQSVLPNDYEDKSNKFNTIGRFACVEVSGVKGASIQEQGNYVANIDSLGNYKLIFAIDNQEGNVYLNDGTNIPFVRVKPNIFQRNISLEGGNELVDNWVIDAVNKKALFSQIKTGADIKNAVKAMTGDITSFKLSDDCYK